MAINSAELGRGNLITRTVKSVWKRPLISSLVGASIPALGYPVYRHLLGDSIQAAMCSWVDEFKDNGTGYAIATGIVLLGAVVKYGKRGSGPAHDWETMARNLSTPAAEVAKLINQNLPESKIPRIGPIGIGRRFDQRGSNDPDDKPVYDYTSPEHSEADFKLAARIINAHTPQNRLLILKGLNEEIRGQVRKLVK